MSIWEKLKDDVLDGPLGAVLKAAKDKADEISEAVSERLSARKDATRQIAFTTAVIVLGAKMAKADGVVTVDEVAAFREVFHVEAGAQKGVARVFNIAKRDAHGFEPYARQVSRLFREQPAVLEQLMDALFHIAKADGQYHPGEKAFLEKVGDIFGFDRRTFRRIEAKHTVAPANDPYRVLGVAPYASNEELRLAYLRQVREHHPDTLVAQGLPEEFVEQANDHMAKINAAWDAIAKDRGLE
jgi:DnaJ like chaperone protein